MFKLEGKCRTTAMGVMPHREVESALEAALSLDIPYWPQLPKLSFYEDMYVQASEKFPGISVDLEQREIHFDLDQFYADLQEYVDNEDNPAFFKLSPLYARVYHQFLQEDLSAFPAIRGQYIGPVSFGLKINDRQRKPIIYDEEVRQVLFPFFAAKINEQYQELSEKNDNAFVWIDEPGLEMLFMSYTGYTSERAQKDYQAFLEELPSPKGIHLCGNPDWSFLLTLDLQIISFDAYQWGHIFSRYAGEVVAFLEQGGIIAWGITPTLSAELENENIDSLQKQLESIWEHISSYSSNLDPQKIARQSLLAPARCCLINEDGTRSVENSFHMLRELSAKLQQKYHL